MTISTCFTRRKVLHKIAQILYFTTINNNKYLNTKCKEDQFVSIVKSHGNDQPDMN
jgi:hypothetical protein